MQTGEDSGALRMLDAVGRLGRSLTGGAGRSFAVYVCVFAVVGAPWLLEARSAIPRDFYPPDGWLVVWILWWVARALSHPGLAFWSPPVNYPAPLQLAASEHFLSSQLIFGPADLLTCNPVLSANLAAFATYPLAALAMQQFLRREGLPRGAAWLGGVAFALGPLRTRANLHVLQYPNLFLPLAGVALRRLRQAPSRANAVALFAVVLIGFFSSYYMAALLGLFLVSYGLFLLRESGPGRARFVTIGGLGLGVASGLLAAASLPYLRLPSFEPVNEIRTPLWQFPESSDLISFSIGLQLLLAAAALRPVVWRDASLSRAARRGVAFAALGTILSLGSHLDVGGIVLPLPYALLAALPVNFFRMPLRFLVLAGFGLAMLAAVGAASLLRRVEARKADGVAFVGGLFLALIAGRLLSSGPYDPATALTRDTPVYRAVAKLIEQRGGGPLLEVPFEPHAAAQALVGTFIHKQPSVISHTGRFPMQRWVVQRAVTALPAPTALDLLRSLTAVRWLLVRPSDGAFSPAARAAMLRELLAYPAVRSAVDVGSWTLLELGGEIAHPEWFDAVARGVLQPGATLVGSPLRALRAEDVRGESAIDIPRQLRAGQQVHVGVAVRNSGAAAWPVLAADYFPGPLVAELLLRWTPVDRLAAQPRAGASRMPLPWDVAPGESVRFSSQVTAPTRPGRYRVDLALNQRGGSTLELKGDREPSFVDVVKE